MIRPDWLPLQVIIHPPIRGRRKRAIWRLYDDVSTGARARSVKLPAGELRLPVSKL